MALRALNKFEHKRLLQKVNDLPLKGERAAVFEQQLNQFYEHYDNLLDELAVVIQNYREVAAKINERQPLVKRKEPQQAV